MVDTLRLSLQKAIIAAMKARDELAKTTLSMVQAEIKNRDIAARPAHDSISDAEILSLLQKMVKQRYESAALYATGGRLDLQQKELDEIAVIQRFLPSMLTHDAMVNVIDGVLSSFPSPTLKDMGKILAVLRQEYAGQMDFATASAYLKERLAR